MKIRAAQGRVRPTTSAAQSRATVRRAAGHHARNQQRRRTASGRDPSATRRSIARPEASKRRSAVAQHRAWSGATSGAASAGHLRNRLRAAAPTPITSLHNHARGSALPWRNNLCKGAGLSADHRGIARAFMRAAHFSNNTVNINMLHSPVEASDQLALLEPVPPTQRYSTTKPAQLTPDQHSSISSQLDQPNSARSGQHARSSSALFHHISTLEQII
ncbi:branchpoint-bridging protein [Dorcoceras hygrometricum]|uniref:Branchpoint-bridging protein n=2 Tax=Dorcoceras hygrometricum TaxID=472368 RepID=A0A2Z7CZ74_9LAMI|nr:branchpoint-bridging protein [Dorcoceras hygrometricum]